MAFRRSYGLVQRLMNQVNQFRGASDDWGNAESLYNKIYLERIHRYLSEHGKGLKVLDGGCGIGIMSIDLAMHGYKVTGIEIHKASLDLMQANAKKAGVEVDAVQGDLLDRLKEIETESFDAALCMGVLYTCAEYREIVRHLGRTLKTGGLFFASFRPPYYFISTLLRKGQFEKALSVRNSSEGVLRLAQTPAYYNWQTHDELRNMFDDSGLEIVELRPTGLYSGVGYDGLGALVDVEAVDDRSMTALYELEKDPGDSSGMGRFTFAIGRKR